MGRLDALASQKGDNDATHRRLKGRVLMVYKVSKDAQIYKTAKIVKAKHNITICEGCIISDFAFIAARNFTMQHHSQVGMGAIIGGGGDVTLRPHSVVGSGSHLIPATESPKAEYMCEGAPPEGRRVIRGSITLGEKAYIGVGATICVSEDEPHIIIGDNAIVGAGAYIDKSIPDNLVVYPKQILVRKPREIWYKERS